MSATTRKHVVSFRATKAERDLLNTIARHRGCTPAEALRQLLDDSAAQIIKEMEHEQEHDHD